MRTQRGYVFYPDIEQGGGKGEAERVLNVTYHTPRRDRYQYPYSYDPIILHWDGTKPEGSVYTDRMREWDREKYVAACDAHLSGVRFDNAGSKRIEAFLRTYTADPGLRLVAVVEYCNWSNGYPTWRLDYIPSPKGNEGTSDAPH